MFEEQPKKEPVDIFADVDKNAGATPGAAAAQAVTQAAVKRSGPSGILLGLVGLIVLGGIGGAAYWYFVVRAQTPAPAAENVAPAPTPTPEPTPEPVVNTAPQPTPEPTPTEPVTPPDEQQLPPDADGDGLSDADEIAAGTNPQAVDTDNDGLTDREELRVYMTDPTNPDTDGDSYLDGDEVKNGYDPKGPGRLFGTPQ